MLADRLALLASRHGVELPSATATARLGLVGTIRVIQPIPLRFTNKAREQLANVDPGITEGRVADALNETDVWTWAEAKDRARTREVLAEAARGERSDELSLLFQTSRWVLRCVPTKERALLVIGVQRPYRVSVARLLLAAFTMGFGADFDAEDLARLVAGQTFASKLGNGLAEEAQAEREMLIGARRYLEAVREYNNDIPVVQNVDFGHTDPQVVLPSGNKARIIISEKKILFSY